MHKEGVMKRKEGWKSKEERMEEKKRKEVRMDQRKQLSDKE